MHHDRETMLAVQMFDSYNGEGPNPWKTFDGRDVPRWEQLGPGVHTKWKAAARAAIKYLGAEEMDAVPVVPHE